MNEKAKTITIVILSACLGLMIGNVIALQYKLKRSTEQTDQAIEQAQKAVIITKHEQDLAQQVTNRCQHLINAMQIDKQMFHALRLGQPINELALQRRIYLDLAENDVPAVK